MTAKVLVVDDVEANVRLLEAKLQHEYYSVITAFSGEQALIRFVPTTNSPEVFLVKIKLMRTQK